MSIPVLQLVGALALIGFGTALDIVSLVEKIRAIVRRDGGKSLFLLPWFFYLLSVIWFGDALHWSAVKVLGGLTLFHLACQVLLPAIVILIRRAFQ